MSISTQEKGINSNQEVIEVLADSHLWDFLEENETLSVKEQSKDPKAIKRIKKLDKNASKKKIINKKTYKSHFSTYISEYSPRRESQTQQENQSDTFFYLKNEQLYQENLLETPDFEIIEKLRNLYPEKERGCRPHPTYTLTSPQKWYYVFPKVFRTYQFEITRKCLTQNTLVCLPTGLGKTYIALNVILNYYKWFPEGKIFFLAPTKPLVTQQIQTLKEIPEIDKNSIVHLDGKTNSGIRGYIYNLKRIFFMTPQTMENDLTNGLITPESVVLLILDEAHRGVGKYAYTEIVKQLKKEKVGFRILALTATPANTFSEIQKIVINLLISNIEIRKNDDMDVRKYLQSRQIIPIHVNSEGLIAKVEDHILRVVQWIWGFLKSNLIGDPEQGIFERRPEGTNYYDYEEINKSFKANLKYYKKIFGKQEISSIYTAIALFWKFVRLRKTLINQGVEVFKISFEEIQNKFVIKAFNQFLIQLRKQKAFQGIEKDASFKNDENRIDHPKIAKMLEIMQEFAKNRRLGLELGDKDSKCIVFTSTRRNAYFINKSINENVFGLRTSIFVGQKQGNKNDKFSIGMSQKEQLEMLKKFKNCKIDCLIATCVAEEGLDIAEVDLILCYDDGLNPIRLLQRMGRTGRKRAGKIYLLLNQSENIKFRYSLKQYETTVEEMKTANAGINESSKEEDGLVLYEANPRMIEPGIKHLELESLKIELSELDSDSEDTSDIYKKADNSDDELLVSKNETKKSKKQGSHNRAQASARIDSFFKPIKPKKETPEISPIKNE